MSLSDRLAKAAQDRSSGPSEGGRSAGPPPAKEQPHGEGIEAGLPAPCPECGGRGFLDSIDLARRLQHEHCTVCAARWSRPI